MLKRKYYYYNEVKTFTVTFDLNGHGTSAVPAVQTVQPGEYVTCPSDPVDSSFTFFGWYTNPQCSGYPFMFLDTPINENIVIYAKWANPHVDQIITYFPLTDYTTNTWNGVFGYLYSGNSLNPVDLNSPLTPNILFNRVSGNKGYTFVIPSTRQDVQILSHQEFGPNPGSCGASGKDNRYSFNNKSNYIIGLYLSDNIDYECIGISSPQINNGELIPCSNDLITRNISQDGRFYTQYTFKYCPIDFHENLSTSTLLIPIFVRKQTTT